jgi:hypothetical protein
VSLVVVGGGGGGSVQPWGNTSLSD